MANIIKGTFTDAQTGDSLYPKTSVDQIEKLVADAGGIEADANGLKLKLNTTSSGSGLQIGSNGLSIKGDSSGAGGAGLGLGVGGVYVRIADENRRGGIVGVAKTEKQTTPVGIAVDGKLYVDPVPVLDTDPTDANIQVWINDNEEGGASGSGGSAITKVRVVLQTALFEDEGNGVFVAAKTVPWTSLPGFTMENCGVIGWTHGTNSNAPHTVTGKSELYPRISTNANGLNVLDRETYAGGQSIYIYLYKIDNYINYG